MNAEEKASSAVENFQKEYCHLIKDTVIGKGEVPLLRKLSSSSSDRRKSLCPNEEYLDFSLNLETERELSMVSLKLTPGIFSLTPRLTPSQSLSLSRRASDPILNEECDDIVEKLKLEINGRRQSDFLTSPSAFKHFS